MSEKKLSDWWNELREDVTNYLRARARLTKLEAYEKVAKVVGVVISFFILAILVGFVIVFILIMLGSWIVQITGSVAIGFSSIAILVLALFIFLLMKRKSILEKPVTGWVIEALFDEEEIFTEESGEEEPILKDNRDDEE